MAAATILKSTYMNDSMDSVLDEEQGSELRRLSQLLSKAGMRAKMADKMARGSERDSTSVPQAKEGKSSETDSIKFKISSKTSRGKKDSTKDTIIDITSDSQVNSNFPNRWSQASLTFNNYFYLFLYLYIT